MPAAKCEDLYVGDAILSVNDQDLRNATHSQAVQVLTRVYGRVKMEVLYVDPQGSDDEGDWENDEAQRYVKYLHDLVEFAAQCIFYSQAQC